MLISSTLDIPHPQPAVLHDLGPGETAVFRPGPAGKPALLARIGESAWPTLLQATTAVSSLDQLDNEAERSKIILIAVETSGWRGAARERRGMLSVRVDRPAEDLVVIGVCGEIDSLTAPKISTTLHCELERQPAVLVLDLTKVSFLGVAGLQVLDCALDRANTLPTALNLVYDDPSVVQSALRAGAMAGLFPTFRTVAQACAR